MKIITQQSMTGFDIWACWDIIVQHIWTLEFCEPVTTFLKIRAHGYEVFVEMLIVEKITNVTARV